MKPLQACLRIKVCKLFSFFNISACLEAIKIVSLRHLFLQMFVRKNIQIRKYNTCCIEA